MNVFEHPENYRVAYAGVPVSDLIARMGYQTEAYRDLYSVDYHIGKTVHEDVHVLEVEHLIKSLKAEHKKFEYKIYEEIPGGHSFNRMDTKMAREIRLEIYRFLDQYLSPPRAFESVRDLEKAAYKF